MTYEWDAEGFADRRQERRRRRWKDMKVWGRKRSPQAGEARVPGALCFQTNLLHLSNYFTLQFGIGKVVVNNCKGSKLRPLSSRSFNVTSISCWCHTSVILVSCWRHTGVMLVSCWRHTGVMLVSCWRHTGVMLVPFWCHGNFH